MTAETILKLLWAPGVFFALFVMCMYLGHYHFLLWGVGPLPSKEYSARHLRIKARYDALATWFFFGFIFTLGLTIVLTLFLEKG